MLVDPGVLPETGDDEGRGQRPAEPVRGSDSGAIDFFRRDYPGESGLRNVLRGDGYFTIDLSIAKGWTMPWSHNQKLRFRWDIFNLTNTARFDVGQRDDAPGPRDDLRQLQRLARDLRRRRRPLHAVRDAVRILRKVHRSIGRR